MDKKLDEHSYDLFFKIPKYFFYFIFIAEKYCATDIKMESQPCSLLEIGLQ